MRKTRTISALLAGLLLCACAQNRTKTEALRSVKTDTARIFGATPVSAFPGKVKASADVNLSFKVAGKIAKMYAGEGDFVRRGQTLANMDNRDYKVQLAATEAEYHRIKAEADRIVELYKSGSVTPNNHDKAVYGLKQISAKYEAHKNALADTRLAAPFDGYVQQRFHGAGETVGAGMPVLSLLEATAPEVEINIPASEFIRRGEFAGFTCTVDLYPEKVYSLTLRGITQKANLNQLYTVRLKMEKEEAPLPAPGMTAMIEIQYKARNSALLSVPYTAVFERDAAAHVWIYNPDSQTISAREVKIAELLDNGTAVISEGLRAGEIVVTAGVHALKEGEKVKLLPPVSPTNAGNLL
jgi:RND family efflux transporter MFP subunit